MAQFAVMHTTKMGSGSGGIGSHIDRTQKKLPKNVDPTKSHLNKEYVATGGTLLKDINRRIEQGYNHRKSDGSLRAIRKDAVKAVGVILSGSHEKMKELDHADRLDEWAEKNLDFMSSKVGRENIVRFTMHMDEKTPHIHCVFVPLDKEGKLCAKEIVGDKKKLSNLQTEYAQEMNEFGLERGLKYSRTKHMTTREYYANIENAAEEVKIDKNMIGAPKSGEEERVQDVARELQHQIITQRHMMENVMTASDIRKKDRDEKMKKLKKLWKEVEDYKKELDIRENKFDKEKQEAVSQALESQTGKIEKVKNDTYRQTADDLCEAINTISRKANLNQRFKVDWKTGELKMHDVSQQQSLFDQNKDKRQGPKMGM